MKKAVSMMVIVVLCLSQSIGFAQEAFTPSPEFSSKAYIAMDLATGELLESGAKDERRYMASLTKMMTALIISESYSLRKEIKSKKDYKVPLAKYSGAVSLMDSKGKYKPIEKNEVFKAKELYDVMMIYSANDAALLFADTISGSERAFVKRMNARAKALGMKNTQFTNCHGMSSGGDEKGQYTTAEDVAILAKKAYANPQIMAAAGLKAATITTGSRSWTYRSSNKLLLERTDVLGLKTGYTKLAGNCFASIIVLGSKDYLVVTLGSQYRSKMFLDHVALYDHLEIKLGLKPPPDFSYAAVGEETSSQVLEVIANPPVSAVSEEEDPSKSEAPPETVTTP